MLGKRYSTYAGRILDSNRSYRSQDLSMYSALRSCFRNGRGRSFLSLCLEKVIRIDLIQSHKCNIIYHIFTTRFKLPNCLALFYEFLPGSVNMSFLPLITIHTNTHKHWEYSVIYVDFAHDMGCRIIKFFGIRSEISHSVNTKWLYQLCGLSIPHLINDNFM